LEKYLEILKMRAEIIDKWREYVVKLAAAVKDVLPDSRVYVFGSVVKGEATAASDIDVLIVSNAVPKSGLERAALKVRIEGSAALPPYHPFELHLVDEEEAEWYFRMVKELREVSGASNI
jgi:predicted nucleotidyltransferase